MYESPFAPSACLPIGRQYRGEAQSLIVHRWNMSHHVNHTRTSVTPFSFLHSADCRDSIIATENSLLDWPGEVVIHDHGDF
jgi:hypothetical protein